MNTVIAISASALVSCYIALMKLGKFEIEVLLNSTLAGGVAIGTGCDLCQNPAAAILVGGIGGGVSAIGYLYINEKLQEKGLVHDTCGVQYLHGIPGIIGAVCGALFVATAGMDSGMVNIAEQEKLLDLTGNGRTLNDQAWAQIGALICTLAVSIIGGCVSGLIASKVGPPLEKLFDDEPHFEHPPYKHIVYREKITEEIIMPKELNVLKKDIN